ncbi:unnamed protein product [Symbiodinium sp. CCMP2592]|nr:unnamed protein product [Symbiodinium sp. CCMP2592]
MAQTALVPIGDGELMEQQIPEPVADQNFNRRKMFELQQELSTLQKRSLKQHEAVIHLETGLKTMISEVDLRRALGLAFQEFENRIEDAFQDSNRKCLGMFSKREDVVELQAAITKKVNWAEYNAVLKKLSDLRQYVDGMAESVFIGQREALESEFSKKANADWVEKSLGEKADFADLNDVRARLERLEVQVSHNDQKHTAKMQAMREETASQNNDMFQRQSVLMKEANSTMTSSKQQFHDMKNMIERHESRLKSVDSSVGELSKAQHELQTLAQKALLPRLESAEASLLRMEQVDGTNREQLVKLESKTEELRGAVDQRFDALSQQGGHFKEQLEFLMQATDMLKRRLREVTKNQTGKMKELADDQDKHVQQLAAVERVLKKQERDVRAMEFRSTKGDTADSWRCALPMLATPDDLDPNIRLNSVLDQLEKIACRSEESTHLAPWNPNRPPLPVSADTTGEWERLSYTNAGGAADAARNGHMAVTSGVRGMYGLSPRTPANTGKMSKKAKRTF